MGPPWYQCYVSGYPEPVLYHPSTVGVVKVVNDRRCFRKTVYNVCRTAYEDAAAPENVDEGPTCSDNPLLIYKNSLPTKGATSSQFPQDQRLLLGSDLRSSASASPYGAKDEQAYLSGHLHCLRRYHLYRAQAASHQFQ